MQEILKLVEEYITKKNDEKTWTPGKDWVQYAGPYFGTEEYTESVKVLLNGWLVLGQAGIRFEHKFPKLMGKDFGVLTNSGSSSNLIMMSALTSRRGANLPKGTKVITPIAGFPTTINPIFQVGFEPAFVDIDLDTLNLNLDQVEERAKEGCKVIMHLDPIIVIDLLVVLVTSHLAHFILHTISLWVKVVLLLAIQRTKRLWLEVSVSGDGDVTV
jgi:CDP-6-deoxy-D-xylo-4-hexulose-3-dehydrase